MSEEVVVIAIIEAKDSAVELVKQAAETLIPKSRADEGCKQYKLHQALDNPASFTFYEIWESQASLDKHNEAAHLKEFIQAIEEHCSNIEIKVMRMLDV